MKLTASGEWTISINGITDMQLARFECLPGVLVDNETVIWHATVSPAAIGWALPILGWTGTPQEIADFRALGQRHLNSVLLKEASMLQSVAVVASTVAALEVEEDLRLRCSEILPSLN